MVLILGIGAYIVYSHETGNTLTDYKNEILNKIDESSSTYKEKWSNENFDAAEAEKKVE